MSQINIYGIALVDKFGNLVIRCNQENLRKVANLGYRGKGPIYRDMITLKFDAECLIFSPELCTDINTLIGKKVTVSATIRKYNFNNRQGWNIYANHIECS
jgi:hypothetical protein